MQLALALLLELTHEDLALLWYQDVEWYIVARLAQDDFVIDSQEIVDYIVNEVKAEFVSEEQSPGGRPKSEQSETGMEAEATAVEVNYRYRHRVRPGIGMTCAASANSSVAKCHEHPANAAMGRPTCAVRVLQELASRAECCLIRPYAITAHL